MSARKHYAALVGLGLACAAVGSPASAAFPERNIEFVVGYGAGGGYSQWALAIASGMTKYLPGGRKVIVRHMPGGGSVIAAEYVQRAQPDGHTIGIYNLDGLAATQLVSKVQYDLAKVTWLGRISVDNEVGLVAAKSPFKSIADMKGQSKTFILSTQGLSATGTIAAAILFQAMDIKWKPLNHDQLGPAALAVIRGDADIYFGTYESTLSYLDAKELRPVVYYDTSRHPRFKDVPTPGDLGFPQLGEMNPQRIIGGPPGIPAAVTKLLADALRKTALEDAEFKKQVEKMKKTVQYASGSETATIVETTLGNYKKYEPTVKKLLEAQ